MKRIYELIPVTCLAFLYFFGFVIWSEFSLYQGVRALLLYSGSVLVALHVRRNDLSKGALIMGLGIISLGPLYTMHLVNEVSIVPFLLAGLWLQVSIHYLVDGGSVLTVSKTDPNQTFLIGTWVAATSVLGVNILFYYPDVVWVSRIFALIAFVIWVYYIILSIKQLISLKGQFKKVAELHGGILLLTVSTQSVVIVCDWAWSLSILLETVFLYIGVFFYLICLTLLVIRYGKFDWKITADWANTNCIIHGAISITGVAWFNLSGTVSGLFVLYWWVGFALFIIVELIEMFRAVKRVKLLGFQKGIWVYHPSQWARVFTFGMFYYLTLSVLVLQGQSPVDQWIQKAVIMILGPVILIITILQLLVMLTQTITFQKEPVKETT
ncbi:hypothetical protein [Pseudalkalibacillus decolorationis]|uniref:hypothetical protein n=1 Tax=Pseudalkalibacillus decolorationis TaxID=163879 RepID=UPI002147F546|nr:hypothetical protein [Pseudalkalibacillus decolorationis]